CPSCLNSLNDAGLAVGEIALGLGVVDPLDARHSRIGPQRELVSRAALGGDLTRAGNAARTNHQRNAAVSHGYCEYGHQCFFSNRLGIMRPKDRDLLARLYARLRASIWSSFFPIGKVRISWISASFQSARSILTLPALTWAAN